jgi:hypothetical protein
MVYASDCSLKMVQPAAYHESNSSLTFLRSRVSWGGCILADAHGCGTTLFFRQRAIEFSSPGARVARPALLPGQARQGAARAECDHRQEPAHDRTFETTSQSTVEL